MKRTLLVSLLVLPGCLGSTPVDEDFVDRSWILPATVHGVTAALHAIASGKILAFDGAALGACTWNDGAAHAQCPAIAENGVKFSRALVFRNVAGEIQQAYDPLTTTRIEIAAILSGQLTTLNFSGVFDHEVNYTVTGLGPSSLEFMVEGTGQGRVDATSSRLPDGTRAVTTYADTTTGGVVSLVPNATVWLLAGSAVQAFGFELWSGADAPDQTAAGRATFAFLGDGVFNVEGMLDDGATYLCTVNAATGAGC